jgi:hypothetical protein
MATKDLSAAASTAEFDPVLVQQHLAPLQQQFKGLSSSDMQQALAGKHGLVMIASPAKALLSICKQHLFNLALLAIGAAMLLHCGLNAAGSVRLAGCPFAMCWLLCDMQLPTRRGLWQRFWQQRRQQCASTQTQQQQSRILLLLLC